MRQHTGANCQPLAASGGLWRPPAASGGLRRSPAASDGLRRPPTASRRPPAAWPAASRGRQRCDLHAEKHGGEANSIQAAPCCSTVLLPAQLRRVVESEAGDRTREALPEHQKVDGTFRRMHLLIRETETDNKPDPTFTVLNDVLCGTSPFRHFKSKAPQLLPYPHPMRGREVGRDELDRCSGHRGGGGVIVTAVAGRGSCGMEGVPWTLRAGPLER